jgi:hypothetical protein
MRFNYDASSVEAIMSDLMASTKFILPPPNLLNVKVTAPALKLLKLPYPICAFEYTCPMARAEPIQGVNVRTGKSSKRIALAYDCSKPVGPVPMLKRSGKLRKDANGILVFSLYYVDDVGAWSPSLGVGYMDETMIGDEMELLIDNTVVRTHMDVFPILQDSVKEMYGNLSVKEETMTLLNDVADEVAMATRACLMLNTKNLKIVKVADAPEKLNKKRAKKDKPPFFEYHTIDIFFSQTGNRVDRKKVNYGEIQQHFNQMTSDKKWGTVMGHFKVRSTGVFWWSEHGRGNKEKGIIEKQYIAKPYVEKPGDNQSV